MLCRKTGTRKYSLERQAARHCILPGSNLSAWTGDRLACDAWMGAPPDYDREGKADDDVVGSWSEPREDIEREGCPGAWYRTPFIESLMRFYRRRDDHGGRVANPALDRCGDWLVHEAILELEHWEDAWRAEYSACHLEAMKQRE